MDLSQTVTTEIYIWITESVLENLEDFDISTWTEAQIWIGRDTFLPEHRNSIINSIIFVVLGRIKDGVLVQVVLSGKCREKK